MLSAPDALGRPPVHTRVLGMLRSMHEPEADSGVASINPCRMCVCGCLLESVWHTHTVCGGGVRDGVRVVGLPRDIKHRVYTLII